MSLFVGVRPLCMPVYAANTAANRAPTGPAGVLEGLFAPNAQNASLCPTAKCTWPSYSTLGVCSTCSDLSSSTTVQCSNSSVNFGRGDKSCTFETPNNLRFTIRFESCVVPVGHGKLSPEWCITAFIRSFVEVTQPWRKAAYIDENGDFVNVTFLRPGSFPPDSGSKPNATVTTCSLSLCEKTYIGSRYEHGSVQNSPASTQPLIFRDFNNSKVWRGSFSGPYGCEQCAQCVGVPLPAPNTSQGHRSDPRLAKHFVDPIININNGRSVGSVFIQDYSEGTRTHARPLPGTVNYALSDTFGHNITLMMESIATGMTNRVVRNPSATFVRGAAWHSVAFVEVRWPWFIYPVSLVLLSVLFWIATTVFSTDKEQTVWKSSSLALLFHGLSGWDIAECQADSTKEMDEAAKKMEVQLTRDENGTLAFVRSQ